MQAIILQATENVTIWSNQKAFKQVAQMAYICLVVLITADQFKSN